MYFAERLPHWCNTDGEPKSWEHFQVGLTRLSHIDHRAILRWYDAMRMAQAVEEDARRTYTDSIKRQAGM